MFDETIGRFEFERRFYCTSLPQSIFSSESSTLILQSYYVHEDNYALRIRLLAKNVSIPMTESLDPINILARYRDSFTKAVMTAKGPSVGGTRYEAEYEIDPDIACELVLRGGSAVIKNRYNVFLGEDGWNIDVFGGKNAPLIIAEAERSVPVTNLVIPKFCTTEITDQARFSNDGLAAHPFNEWSQEYLKELEEHGVFFMESFGRNRIDDSL